MPETLLPFRAWLSGAWHQEATGRLQRLRHCSFDLVVGLTGGLAGIPDGMAASVVAGVPPIHGLYASVFGPLIGGLVSRTSLLVITTTSASALAASESIGNREGESRVAALVLLTFLAGAFQVLASLAGLARLTSFVSHSVMTGFLMGIGVLIILGQLGTLVGYDPEGSGPLARTGDLALHVTSFNLPTMALGLLAIVVLLLAMQVHASALGPILALAVPSLVASLAGLTSVMTVGDVSAIPSSLPVPELPDLGSLDLSLATGAISVAAIIFVQTAGVAQALPGQSGLGNASARDLTASGLANAGSAVFQGQPVGGSLGQSALNVKAGARTRLAAITSGIWVLLAIMLFAGLVELVVMTALAAILLVAALGVIDLGEGLSIWRTNWMSRSTIVATFTLTLILPIQLAVGAGVLLSAGLYLFSAATDVHVVELVRAPDGQILERRPPEQLGSDSVTSLQVYGSLFYAGARTLGRRLPRVGESHRAVLILRLRGKTRAGATAIDVLARYASGLMQNDGRLYLAGLTPELQLQLESNEKLAGVRLFSASSQQGASLAKSMGAARDWLIRRKARSASA